MDDDDDFLYGTEEPAVKRARVEPEGAEDDEEPHSQTTKQQEPEDDSESEYESDDSDIDIVIDTGAPSKLASTASAAAKKEAPAAPSAAPEASDTPKEESGAEERPQPAAKMPGIDIDKVGMLDGKPITEHNLEEFEDKPWRMPGADITDYFNYGFDEFTWMAYCDKQNQIRGEYNPQNMMAMMGMSMMGMPGMGGGGQMPMPGGEGMPDMFKMMQGMNPPK